MKAGIEAGCRLSGVGGDGIAIAVQNQIKSNQISRLPRHCSLFPAKKQDENLLHNGYFVL